MGRTIAAYTAYTLVLIIMVVSALWVMWDAWKNKKPWAEIIVWGLFSGAFVVLGPILYVFWKKKFG